MAPKTSGEVWKPRAIRHVERVERQAAVQPAAEPTVEPGPSAPAEGLRTDDLDELDAPSAGRGDDLDLPTKRQKVDDTAAVDEPVIKAEVAAAKERGESLEDEVIAGAPRLAQHIKSAAKCIKVAAMAYSLLEQGAVTSRSSGAFFEVVDAAMEEPMRPIVEPKYRVAYRKLFEGLLKRKHAFSTEQQQRIDEWQFQLTTSLELVQADDSFAFSRAAKKVVERLDRLKPDVMPPGKSATDYDPPELAARWAPVLLVCIASAWLQYGKSLWAKPAVEGLVRAAMGCRRQWADADARQIEEWNQVCKGAAVQRKATGPAFLTSFDADSARWRAADVSVAKKKTGEGGAGSSFQN